MAGRSYFLKLGALFGGTLAGVTWFVFHSAGFDWMWTDAGAVSIYTGFWKYKEYPYFSFFNNGGIYQIQDPQGILLSLNSLLAILLGPVAGSRWSVILLASVGLFGMYCFMKKTVQRPVAALCSVFWVVSLGFAWRFAVGHDMFAYWYLLPFTLIIYEKFWCRPSFINGLILGVWMGLIVLGPTFHALTYLILPALATYAIILFSCSARPTFSLFFGFLLFSSLIALFVASPKIASWISMNVHRGRDVSDGVYSLSDAIYCLFATARASFSGFRILGPKGDFYYGVWEGSVALVPTASLMAIFSFFERRPDFFSKKLFAIILIFLGLTLSSQLWLWRIIQQGFFSGIRVPSRFLSLSAFGIAILSGIGLNWTIQKWPRFRLAFLMAFLAGGLAFTADWTKRIQKNNVLRQAAIPFLSLPPVAQNLPLQMIGTIASAPVLNGTIVITSLCPVGSGCISRDYGDPGMFEDPLVQLTSAPGSVVKLDNLTVTHLTFKVFSLQSRESRILNLRYPRLGWELVQIDPAEAAVQLRPVNSLIQIENLSDEPIRFVTIRVLPVTPKWVWLLSFITLIIGFLSILASGRITPRLRHLPPNSLDSPPI